jgi:hypothetical protein
MPQFVVLTHDHPFLHWDLMLQQGDVLRTWRLKEPPDAEIPIIAEELPDHRLAYLDYEGPVSGDRGTVTRWDAGTYEMLESTSNRFVFHFAGKKLVGVAPLKWWSAKGCLSNLPAETLSRLAGHWTFWRLPPKGPARTIKIPTLLNELIAARRWPATGDEAWKQRCAREPMVPEDRVNRLAPDQKRIDFNAPPFLTVRELALDDSSWCEPWSDPSGIDFDLAVAIGDFGIASDSPILLDYRQNLENPRAIRLLWSSNGNANRWVPMAEDFPSFVRALGL